MTGIQGPHEYVADAQDELQFHLELGGTPPPASTVATSDTYILERTPTLSHRGLEKAME